MSDEQDSLERCVDCGGLYSYDDGWTRCAPCREIDAAFTKGNFLALRARVAELEKRNAELVDLVYETTKTFINYECAVLTPEEYAAAEERARKEPTT